MTCGLHADCAPLVETPGDALDWGSYSGVYTGVHFRARVEYDSAGTKVGKVRSTSKMYLDCTAVKSLVKRNDGLKVAKVWFIHTDRTGSRTDNL